MKPGTAGEKPRGPPHRALVPRGKLCPTEGVWENHRIKATPCVRLYADLVTGPGLRVFLFWV